MTDPDRLAEIKARRLPCRPCDQGLEGDCTCLDWREHAPADIDWLIRECERLQETEERLHDAQVTIGKLSHEIARLRKLVGEASPREILGLPDD